MPCHESGETLAFSVGAASGGERHDPGNVGTSLLHTFVLPAVKATALYLLETNQGYPSMDIDILDRTDALNTSARAAP